MHAHLRLLTSIVAFLSDVSSFVSLDLAFVTISVVFFSGESSRDIFGEEIHFVATSRIAEQAIRIRSRRAVITLVIAMRARADRASASACE